jgi:hypothetical protein
MTMRTLSETLTFAHSFLLPGLTKALPPGAYEVEHEEELVEDLTFPVYRRTLTYFYVPNRQGGSRTFRLQPNELEAILAHDGAAA